MDRRELVRPVEGFDEQSMTIEMELEVACGSMDCKYCQDPDPQDPCLEAVETAKFPAKYELCATCLGRGEHVNPSVDSYGISQEEFDEDPDFKENYFSGVYNVTCNECAGRRVVPVIDDEKCSVEQKKRLSDYWAKLEREARYRRESYVEQMMGY